jgi:hypothetical protein
MEGAGHVGDGAYGPGPANKGDGSEDGTPVSAVGDGVASAPPGTLRLAGSADALQAAMSRIPMSHTRERQRA